MKSGWWWWGGDLVGEQLALLFRIRGSFGFESQPLMAAILTGVFRGFPQSLQANSGIVTDVNPSYHSTLHNLTS
jgi:hypothetical protein